MIVSNKEGFIHGLDRYDLPIAIKKVIIKDFEAILETIHLYNRNLGEGLSLYCVCGGYDMAIMIRINSRTSQRVLRIGYLSMTSRSWSPIQISKWIEDTIDELTKSQKLIKKVIFNPPATIVFFSDGTKTVVKCQNGEEFDEEKGLAMAIIKHGIGLGVFNKVLESAERRYPISINWTEKKDINNAWVTKGKQIESAIRKTMLNIISYYGETEENSCYDIDLMVGEVIAAIDDLGLV